MALGQLDLQLTEPFKLERKDTRPKVTSETEIYKDEVFKLTVQRLASTSEGLSIELFRLVRKEGGKSFNVDLEEILGPAEQVDTFTIEGGEVKDGRIKIFVLREGVYDYRGTSKVTYNVVWDANEKKFSKVDRDESSATSLAERSLRAALSHKCNSLKMPDQKIYSENVTCLDKHETFLYYQKLYFITFQEMHRCALWFRATNRKQKAADLLASTMDPKFKSPAEDWICSACHAEGEAPDACSQREEIFYGDFMSENPIVAGDYGLFLSEFWKYKQVASKIFSSLVIAHPDNAQARLYYADDLWKQGKKKKAKEEYSQFLFLSHGVGALKDAKSRASARGGKFIDPLAPGTKAPTSEGLQKTD